MEKKKKYISEGVIVKDCALRKERGIISVVKSIILKKCYLKILN